MDYTELVKNLRGECAYALPSQTRKALCEAADAIEELISKLNHADEAIVSLVDAAEERRWIPVEERLPVGGDASGEICENVNLLLNDGLVTCGWMNGITGKAYYLNVRDDYVQKTPISRVTHWMPLPKPPKEETE